MTRQSAHHANLREKGWRRVQVWLSPEDVALLTAFTEVAGSQEEALRIGLRRMARTVVLLPSA